MLFFTLSLILIATSIYLLFLGLKVFLPKKPFLISAKYNFFIIFIAFALQLVLPVSNLFRYFGDKEADFDWFLILMPLFLVVFYSISLFYFWKTMQGYMIFGTTEDSLRRSLQSILTKLGLPFEERLSKMHLTSLETDLQCSINAWAGVATIKIKDSQYKETENKIAEELSRQFINEDYPVNLRTSYFYFLTGGLLFIFFLVFSYWTWTNESFWKNL